MASDSQVPVLSFMNLITLALGASPTAPCMPMSPCVDCWFSGEAFCVVVQDPGTVQPPGPIAPDLGRGEDDLSKLVCALSTALLTTVTTSSFVTAHAVIWKSAWEGKHPQANMPLQDARNQVESLGQHSHSP